VTFWTSPDLEPLKQNRFRIVFTPTREMLNNLDFLDINTQSTRTGATNVERVTALTQAQARNKTKDIKGDFWWWVKSCTLPSYEIAMSEYQLVNQKFKYPGMLVWNDVSISMVDTSAVTERLMAMLGLAGYGEGPACDNSGISKDGFTNQGDFRIQIIDSEGGVLKQWKLEGWFFRNVRFGEVSYESDELVTLEMALGYDYAVLENSKGGSVVGELKETIEKEREFANRAPGRGVSGA